MAGCGRTPPRPCRLLRRLRGRVRFQDLSKTAPHDLVVVEQERHASQALILPVRPLSCAVRRIRSQRAGRAHGAAQSAPTARCGASVGSDLDLDAMLAASSRRRWRSLMLGTAPSVCSTTPARALPSSSPSELTTKRRRHRRPAEGPRHPRPLISDARPLRRRDRDHPASRASPRTTRRCVVPRCPVTVRGEVFGNLYLPTRPRRGVHRRR